MLVTLPEFETSSQDGSSHQAALGTSSKNNANTSVRDNESELGPETSSLAVNYETDNRDDSIHSFPLCEDLEDTAVRRKRGRLSKNSSLIRSEIPEGSAVQPGIEDDLPDADSSLLKIPSKYADQAEEFVKKIRKNLNANNSLKDGKVWAAGWNVAHHHTLPEWLKDNDYLLRGHRVPTNSFLACFKSIFRIHTETGNIWTHLLGMIAFIGIAIYFLSRPSIEIQWQEKAVFSAFFVGAILCLGFSWVFHTVFCHSERVGRLFNKLDYVGIALLTVGSFVPWLYYSFYCRLEPKVTYLALIFFLGTICIVVSMWDKFATPKYRSLRAGVFVALGLSGIIPALHYIITDGFWHAINYAALGWLLLMAFLYIMGAFIYAVRIPERIFPGKFDIWFQSHQIFHVFVLAAAFVHYHGISEIANYRLTLGDCIARELQ